MAGRVVVGVSSGSQRCPAIVATTCWLLRWLRGGLPVAMCSATAANDHMSLAGLPRVLLLWVLLAAVVVVLLLWAAALLPPLQAKYSGDLQGWGQGRVTDTVGVHVKVVHKQMPRVAAEHPVPVHLSAVAVVSSVDKQTLLWLLVC